MTSNRGSSSIMMTKSNNPTGSQQRLTRLAAFLIICLTIGCAVLFFLISPLTNPNILLTSMARSKYSPLERSSIEGYGLFGKDSVMTALDEPGAINTADLAIFPACDIEFKSTDGQSLHGLYFETPKAIGTALVSWGGICDMRLPVALGYVKVLQKANLSALLFDYRGYGRSAGKSTIDSMPRDLEGAYNYLVSTKKIAPKKIVLFGRSLGSYFALKLSEKHSCRALIMEDCWTNVKDYEINALENLAMRAIPINHFPSDGMDTLHLLKGIHVPLLIVKTGFERDGSLPEVVYERASQPKQFLKIDSLYADCKTPDFRSTGIQSSEGAATEYASKIKELTEQQ